MEDSKEWSGLHASSDNGKCSPTSITSEDSNDSGVLVAAEPQNVEECSRVRRLISAYYVPLYFTELERLFLKPLTGRQTPDVDDDVYPRRSVWDHNDEELNEDSRMDNIENLIKNLKASVYSGIFNYDKPEPIVESPVLSPSPPAPEPPISSALPTSSSGLGLSVQDILAKAHLIDILREREQLQRAKPATKKATPAVAATKVLSPAGIVLKSSSSKSASAKVCVFCRNNGEAESVYTSHHLKDPEGNVTCPILYIYTCPICGASGKKSHTIKYCPYNTGEQPLVNKTTVKPLLTSTTCLSDLLQSSMF